MSFDVREVTNRFWAISRLDRPAAASWAARLAGGQRIEPAEDEPPGSAAGGDQFGAGPLGQGERAVAVGEVERAAKDVAAFRPLSGPPEGRPEVGHGAGVFQPGAGVLEHALLRAAARCRAFRPP